MIILVISSLFGSLFVIWVGSVDRLMLFSRLVSTYLVSDLWFVESVRLKCSFGWGEKFLV